MHALLGYQCQDFCQDWARIGCAEHSFHLTTSHLTVRYMIHVDLVQICLQLWRHESIEKSLLVHLWRDDVCGAREVACEAMVLH